MYITSLHAEVVLQLFVPVCNLIFLLLHCIFAVVLTY